MVEDDVGHKVTGCLDTCVLVDLGSLDRGVGLDVGDHNSSGVLVAHWPMLLMPHNDIDSIDGFVRIH